MEVFIHTKNDLKKSVLKYVILLIPLYFYGIYKNGILLYQRNLIGFFDVFKLVYLVLIGLFMYVISSILIRKKLKIDLDFLNIFILPLFMPFNVNYLIYGSVFLIGSIFYGLVSKYFNFNKLAFMKLLIILLMYYFSYVSYANIAEDMNLYVFSVVDLLWGRNIGGLGSTSIIIGAIILVILSITNNYKYIVSLSSIVAYLGLGFFINRELLLVGSNILALMFVATDSISSPINVKLEVLYGIFIGLLGAYLSRYLNIYECVFVSILICSVLYEIVCKIAKKVL